MSPSHSRPVLCLFFIFLVCFIVCFLLQATYFATFRLADSFDRGCFCSCCSYIFKIFRVGEGVFPPSLFCAFSGFFFTSVCLFACAFGLLSLAFVWPNFFFDFASFLSSFSKLVYCFRGFLLAVAGTLVEQLVLLLFSFWNLLESFGFKQHVTGPTHKGGHTLDLIVTQCSDCILSAPPKVDCYLSDHASVCCKLASQRPPLLDKVITFRKYKDIDLESFKRDLDSSSLCQSTPTVISGKELDELACDYNNTVCTRRSPRPFEVQTRKVTPFGYMVHR